MALNLFAVASYGTYPSDRDPVDDWYALARSHGLFSYEVVAVPGGGAPWEIVKDVAFDIVFDVVR
jgi:hypothetical protein